MTGSLAVDWIEHGAAVAMRKGAGAGPRDAVWSVGRDGDEAIFHVHDSDARGVSRIYDISLSGPN